ncbi:CobW family GTP-binding protein [Sinorhizobium alkalisoli]|uniref:Cobalamin biosynthesis protein CobW n=1 Tax=Sinorhizobium alkalisoli TaxID=1752398 RepID=A0A1E3VFX0_9HYPH|nr:GTP-binding protein [Sinorhizobium alkalisoli]ODR92337.1 cobalamin biosynthesis protein CobW [Sinorhizobium alkalisoli]QFI70717.1 Putative metal chaperone, involved in Zn homeostasis, GTPase of COG0523 family [Sinorhizobium alkalisoli]
MRKINATILTGFLGAGKTTLLNRLLTERPDERIAVVINEFGQVGIDGKLVIETTEDVVELNNGCICCTVRDDLIGALRNLLASDRAFDRIVIETSGLADPAPVIQSFVLDEVLSSHVQLDAIVTVVDACHVDQQLGQDEAVEQISFADLILLNKTDLVSLDKLAVVERRIRQLNPLARVVHTKDCAIPMSSVLDLGAFDLKNILSIDPAILEDHEHEHDQSISCVALQRAEPLDPAAFNSWLNRLVQASGADILRMKGVVNFAGEARRYVFHGVHMTLEGRPGKPWMGDPRLSEIVFIGRNLDEAELGRGLESCVPCALAVAT